jgi:hypothetical protein
MTPIWSVFALTYDHDLNRLQLAQTSGPNAKTFAFS